MRIPLLFIGCVERSDLLSSALARIVFCSGSARRWPSPASQRIHQDVSLVPYTFEAFAIDAVDVKEAL